MNRRKAIRDTYLPRGGGLDGRSPIFVPKGYYVTWCLYAMHRRKVVYGDDAEVFRPERWEGFRPSSVSFSLRLSWDLTNSYT